jgi:hypothetical protein
VEECKPLQGGLFLSLNAQTTAAEVFTCTLDPVQPAGYCSPRHRVPFNSRHEDSKFVG